MLFWLQAIKSLKIHYDLPLHKQQNFIHFLIKPAQNQTMQITQHQISLALFEYCLRHRSEIHFKRLPLFGFKDLFLQPFSN